MGKFWIVHFIDSCSRIKHLRVRISFTNSLYIPVTCLQFSQLSLSLLPGENWYLLYKEFSSGIIYETLGAQKDLLQEPHANPNAATWAKESFLTELAHSTNAEEERMRCFNVHLDLWEPRRANVQKSLSPPVISGHEWGVKHSICLT